MNPNLKPNERELVKVANFFKRQSKKLIAEGKLSPEHARVEETVDNFVAQMEFHANSRSLLLAQRKSLDSLVKDNAECPECNKKDKLKTVGTERNDKGWKSNRYRCRRCNIEFTWNRPNNPWDMIAYIEELLGVFKLKIANADTPDAERQQLAGAIESLEGNLAKLKPVIEAHDKEYAEFTLREEEMDRLVHEFKNSLLIEKIKMDTWENKQR